MRSPCHPSASKLNTSPRLAGSGNGKISFYAPGYFPSSKPTVPPIYATTLRRSKEALEVRWAVFLEESSKEQVGSSSSWGFGKAGKVL